jgi:hypothetical protein
MKHPARILAGAALAAWCGLAAAAATGQIIANPALPVDELTPELLERLRYGRAVHEEFAGGVGCTECHARDPRVPLSLRGEFDPVLEKREAR